ncbi:hypothetical protein PHMEG_0002153 [Phytophthora megakarya]|uniref:Retrotransposon gag domain-containing protein n=1 Tax=Phytophthora megakarya TaxID=4795 RepID=A0A225X1G1_9STRA|nr:hypothetical protein PHMEG_0002153 [Phytophthora megakarya]
MSRSGKRYCPLGTRDKLHDEIRNLRKTRSMSVKNYGAAFRYLEEWVPKDDGVEMTRTGQFRYYSEGMPQTWKLQVVPQRERWSNLNTLEARYLQCEQLEVPPPTKDEKKGRRNEEKKYRQERDDGTQKTKGSNSINKKRKLEVNTGCSFSKKRRNVWNNHANDDCFRSPASLKFRSRANKGNEHMARKEKHGPGNEQSTAAVVIPVSCEIDPLDYWYNESQVKQHGTAVRNENWPRGHTLRTKVPLKHPLSKQSTRSYWILYLRHH